MHKSDVRVIRFTHTGHNPAIGNFSDGGIARVPSSLAEHMVNQVRCAVYDKADTGKPAVMSAVKVLKAGKGNTK